jgi:hypothetical protein
MGDAGSKTTCLISTNPDAEPAPPRANLPRPPIKHKTPILVREPAFASTGLPPLRTGAYTLGTLRL